MQIIPLKISTIYNNQEVELYPSLIVTEEDIILVDCGFEGSYNQIKDQLALHEINIESLTGIIVSHDDIDHVGGLSEIVQAHPSIKIYAPEMEAPFISGAKKSLRLQQAEELFHQLPDDHKPWALGFQESLKSINRVPVDRSFNHGTSIVNELTIVPTPGHTPGHVSLYVPKLKILIANDAVVVDNGELNIANPDFCLDLPKALESVERISNLEIDQMICYHGGMVKNDVSLKLKELHKKYKNIINRII